MRKTGNKLPVDLLIILAWIMTAVFVIIDPMFDNSLIKVVIGIPMVLFIPGYVTIGAFFPKKDDLEIAGRISLSLGLSICIVPILGILLNFSFGIKVVPILMTLFLYTTILIFITTYRRRQYPEDVQFSIQLNNIYSDISNEFRPKNMTGVISNVVLILLIMLTVGTIYFTVTTPKIGERFTEFYVLNSNGATSYHTELKVGSPEHIRVGISNHEYTSINYTVNISLNKELLASKNMILGNNQTWEDNITIVPTREINNARLELLLFKDNNLIDPYRMLYLQVNSRK